MAEDPLHRVAVVNGDVEVAECEVVAQETTSALMGATVMVMRRRSHCRQTAMRRCSH